MDKVMKGQMDAGKDGWRVRGKSHTNHHLIQYSVALESAKAGENLH